MSSLSFYSHSLYIWLISSSISKANSLSQMGLFSLIHLLTISCPVLKSVQFILY